MIFNMKKNRKTQEQLNNEFAEFSKEEGMEDTESVDTFEEKYPKTPNTQQRRDVQPPNMPNKPNISQKEPSIPKEQEIPIDIQNMANNYDKEYGNIRIQDHQSILLFAIYTELKRNNLLLTENNQLLAEIIEKN